MKKEMFELDCQDDGLFKYPPIKKIAFEDGTIQTYVHIDRISPQLARAEHELRHSINISVGYLLRPRRKNRIHRCER
jgi:hypothetical protein